MSDGNPEDTGQISVAELLARNGQKTNLTSGGRRRRGVKGGISVAELTGEIPVLRDEPSTDESPKAAADRERDSDTATPVASEPEKPRTVAPRPVPQASTNRATRPTPLQPAARRDRQKPEPELLSGSTTVAGDLLNQSHDDNQRRNNPNRQSSAAERLPYGAKAAEQGPSRRPTGFQRPRSAASEEATDVTVKTDLVAPDDLAKTAASPRLQLATDKQTGKQATNELDTKKQDTAESDLEKPETGSETDTALEPETEAKVSRSDRRKSVPKSKEGPKSKGGAVRQWLVLVGQAIVSIVVGALLFKGFEQLWDVLPWVALVLSVLVIVGLVAVVRILRRTDDLISIVIAIAVGVFVTLGPLAFQLSTG